LDDPLTASAHCPAVWLLIYAKAEASPCKDPLEVRYFLIGAKYPCVPFFQTAVFILGVRFSIRRTEVE